MPVRQIVYSDNPLLRQTSRRVKQVSPTIQKLIRDMIDTMRSANGVGLAAIQVGVPERVIVVELPEEPSADDEEEEPRAKEEGIEGCLSVPGWVGEVSRHLAITVKGQDVKGKPVRLKAEGMFARVLQHEIDHCDGVLFIDRIEDTEKIWPVAEGEEEAAERASKESAEQKEAQPPV
jgi:peptide deformylase